MEVEVTPVVWTSLPPQDMWRLPNLVRRANLASALSRVSRLNGCGRMKGRLTKICDCTSDYPTQDDHQPGYVSEAVGLLDLVKLTYTSIAWGDWNKICLVN